MKEPSHTPMLLIEIGSMEIIRIMGTITAMSKKGTCKRKVKQATSVFKMVKRWNMNDNIIALQRIILSPLK